MFGIAKFATALQSTRSGTVKGKAAYLAPEQLVAGKAIDGRVDLFVTYYGQSVLYRNQGGGTFGDTTRAVQRIPAIEKRQP